MTENNELHPNVVDSLISNFLDDINIEAQALVEKKKLAYKSYEAYALKQQVLNAVLKKLNENNWAI